MPYMAKLDLNTYSGVEWKQWMWFEGPWVHSIRPPKMTQNGPVQLQSNLDISTARVFSWMSFNLWKIDPIRVLGCKFDLLGTIS